jgi:hypothetical protein
VELPLVGLSLSQAASSLKDQVSVPMPEFQISSVPFAGAEPPSPAVKVRLSGLKDISGAAELICRLTGTVCGLLLAPPAVMVMSAE